MPRVSRERSAPVRLIEESSAAAVAANAAPKKKRVAKKAAPAAAAKKATGASPKKPRAPKKVAGKATPTKAAGGKAGAKAAGKGAAKGKGKAKKEKDPNKPKRASSAYIFFANEKRAEVRAKHKDWSLAEVTKELGAMWGKLNDKTKFNKMAEQDKLRYEKAMEAYNKGK